MRLLDQLPAGLRPVLDATSIATLLGSLASVLPSIATLLTILWSCIRIFETETVQRILKRKEGEE